VIARGDCLGLRLIHNPRNAPSWMQCALDGHNADRTASDEPECKQKQSSAKENAHALHE